MSGLLLSGLLLGGLFDSRLLDAAESDAGKSADVPRVLDERLEISLFAEQPQIVTPTGLDVDEQGRVWALESNTHFRPEGYEGHPSDRLLVLRGSDPGRPADDIRVFADGFVHSMSVAVRPVWMPPMQLDRPWTPEAVDLAGAEEAPEQVYVATRGDVWLLEDLDHDGVADRRTALLHLDTKGNYPHNGFAGFAFDPFGWMYVGMGENLGEPFKVVDRRGQVVFDGAEGGNVYRMRPDGAEFQLWARGFWNPHASCLDSLGRMFTVDNDPDSRPPCRLLHVVEQGNYGYRFSNGRKGLHPFTSWNGEVPGTLPMVAGTGEAPSGILACGHAAWPEEFQGDLLATSWGDHRIERFRLRQRGASFEALAEPLVQGGESFRPVGIAQAPDGALFCTDWVLRDYNLHRQGRIWRIAPRASLAAAPDAAQGAAPGAVGAPSTGVADSSNIAPSPRQDALALRRSASIPELTDALSSPRLVVRRTAARRLAVLRSGALVSVVRNREAPEIARFEAIAALTLHRGPDDARVLKSNVPTAEGPFDAVQRVMAREFGESPGVGRSRTLLARPEGAESGYLLACVDSLAPLFRSLGGGRREAAIEVLNDVVRVDDPFVYAQCIEQMARVLTDAQLAELIKDAAGASPALQQACVLAARRVGPQNVEACRAALHHPNPGVRRAAVQWAAEERLVALRPDVAAVFESDPITPPLFLATLAALEGFEGRPPQQIDASPADRFVAPLLASQATPAVKAMALRLASPSAPEVSLPILLELQQHADPTLSNEAAWSLGLAALPGVGPEEYAAAVLPILNSDEHRVIALLGLSGRLAALPEVHPARMLLETAPLSPELVMAFRQVLLTDPAARAVLLDRLGGRDEVPSAADQARLVEQAALALGGEASLPESLRSLATSRPRDAAGWRDYALNPNAAQRGRPERGKIVFFHPHGPLCARCHRLEGRGGDIGPDLSVIGAALTRERLVDSILEPSREIAPQFTGWQVVTDAGLIHTGMIVHENEGKTVLGSAEGVLMEIPTAEIVDRTPQRTSVMPERLTDRMTPGDFLDLLSFLESAGRRK